MVKEKEMGTGREEKGGGGREGVHANNSHTDGIHSYSHPHFPGQENTAACMSPQTTPSLLPSL